MEEIFNKLAIDLCGDMDKANELLNMKNCKAEYWQGIRDALLHLKALTPIVKQTECPECEGNKRVPDVGIWTKKCPNCNSTGRKGGV